MAKTKKDKIGKNKVETSKKVAKESKPSPLTIKNTKQISGKSVKKNENGVPVPSAQVKNKQAHKANPLKNKNKGSKEAKTMATTDRVKTEKSTEVLPPTNVAQKKLKKEKAAVEVVVKSTEGLSAADIAKIEKKKAKKLRQKLKKKEQKEAIKAAGLTKSKAAGDVSKPGSEAASTQPKSTKQQKGKKNAAKDRDSPREPPNPALAAATVFVGNLPINTKRVQLVKLFADFSPVNAIRFRTADGRPMFKHKTRKQAGALIAYVVLKDAETAQRALSLNGTEFKGNHLRVTGSDNKPGEENAKRTIFVGNLKFSATEDKLRNIFSTCGEIEYVRCLRDGEKGCKGVAYVCFKAPDAVGLALELNETILDERPIHVQRYSVKKLGAKEARDKIAAKEKRGSKKGGKKHLTGKLKEAKKLPQVKKNDDADAAGKKKKSEFRGVKVNAIKKQKKKKLPSQLLQLANKIAPKPDPK